MRQKNDPVFQSLLGRARRGELNIRDVEVLNDRVATKLPVPTSLDSVVVVRKNDTRHMINRLQIMQFARDHHQTVIIFPAEHFRTKKKGGGMVKSDLLFGLQDGDSKVTSTGPGLLYYCKGMPARMLANQCTPVTI